MNYSVVIPVYNEAECVEPLFFRLKSAMEGLEGEYEILYVDDASDDDSTERFRRLCAASKNLRAIRLKNRSGQSAALQAGFDHARGDIIITLDGDLQNDPADIPKLIDKMKEGYDVVCGWRYERKDAAAKKIMSGAANRIRRVVTGEKTHDVGCALKAFKRECVRRLYLSSGLHRFLSGLAAKLGCRVGEVKVSHHPRVSGVTKYGFWKRFLQGARDLIWFWQMDEGRIGKRIDNYEIKEIIGQ